jgi:hypothetical protein
MKSQKCTAGFGSQFPPDETHVRVYFLQQGSTTCEAARFFNHYRAKGWRDAKGHRLKNWKVLAWTRIWYQQTSTNS